MLRILNMCGLVGLSSWLFLWFLIFQLANFLFTTLN